MQLSQIYSRIVFDKCLAFIRKKIKDNNQYYLLIDEVQMMNEFEDMLNSCLHIENLDTYVTGSNSKFLSKDVITEFRGRGDEIYLRPLSFAEFWSAKEGLDFDHNRVQNDASMERILDIVSSGIGSLTNLRKL